MQNANALAFCEQVVKNDIKIVTLKLPEKIISA